MISPRHLGGTRLAGTLHIDQTAVNDLLRLSSPQPLLIEIQPESRIVLRYKVFHVHATLPPTLQLGPSPQITVTLDSIVVAWGLKAAIHESFVRIHGRDVTIKLAEVPVLEPWREWLQHLKAVEFTTDAGRVGARFTIEIAG